MMLEGAKVRFVPSHIAKEKQGTSKPRQSEAVEGKIVYVNWMHKYFVASFGSWKESFKFSQLGNEVKIIG